MTNWLNRTLITGPNLTLCLNEDDYREAIAEIDAKGEMDWLNGGRACAYWFDHQAPEVTVIVVLNSEGLSGVEICGYLAHEATHVFQFHAEYIGEHKPSREFMAYSIQNITVQLLESYEKQTKGNENAK